MAKEAVVVFSGGPDSTAAALWALAQGYSVELLTFQFKNIEQYGELYAAMTVANMLKLQHTVFDFKSPMQHFKSNVHILMHAGTPRGSKATEVPHTLPFGPGMILSTAANYAAYYSKDVVVWGATKDDGSSGRFEYTKEFCDQMASMVSKCIGRPFEIAMPFSQLHKWEIFSQNFIGKEDLFAETWSCKMGGATQSGNCQASVARRISARVAGLQDRTSYQTKDIDWVLSDADYKTLSAENIEKLVHICRSEKPGPGPGGQ